MYINFTLLNYNIICTANYVNIKRKQIRKNWRTKQLL